MEYIEDEFIVIYKDQWDGRIDHQTASVVADFVDARLSELEIPDSLVKNRYERVLRGFTAKLNATQLNTLENNPQVDYVVQNTKFKMAAISFSEESNAIPSSSFETISSTETIPWGVERVGGVMDGTGEQAWIVDSGIDLQHNDLDINDNDAASFVTEGVDDDYGHGTYVAGILAAKNNGAGIVGVAAGAKVVPVRVLNSEGEGTPADVADAVDYITGRASTSDIINMSLQHPAGSSTVPMESAIVNAADNGFRFVIAAGNFSDPADNWSPGRVEHSNVWTVSAFDSTDTFWHESDNSGSNYGNPPIEYSGPGVDVPSLQIGGGWGYGFVARPEGDDGTSYGAPHIAGLLLASSDGVNHGGVVNNDLDSNPDIIAVQAVLSVEIVGSSVLETGQQGSWEAFPEDGEGAYNYQWYYRQHITDPWSEATGANSKTFTHTFNESSNDAGVRVVVTSAGASAEDAVLVTINEPPCDPSDIGCTE